MPLESRTMRIVRNIAVVFEPELCRARQKNRRKFALYACNATQPHFLQQLARQESASVQDKYFSIPTLKASFQWAYEPFRKSRFPPLYACKNAPLPRINPRKITTYPFNNPQSFRGAMLRFCAQSGLPLRGAQGRRSMALDNLLSCLVAKLPALPSPPATKMER